MGNKKTVDWERVDKLCRSGCNSTEIAACMGFHRDVLYKHALEEKGMHWADYKSMMRSTGNASLKEKQYDIAIDGDRTMLIWLGKNRLKQAERSIVENKYQDLKNKTDEELIAELGLKRAEKSD